MTPQELLTSILQQAIQGKLVEQRPEEGTAEDLFQQIQEEKKTLVAAGLIKKEKNLSAVVVEQIPFDIPNTWKWVKLGNILREVIVPMRDKPPFSNEGIPWCRIEDRDGFLLNGSKSNQLVSTETIQAMNLKVLPIGTVLSACTGGSIGTIVINTIECCTNQTFNGLVCSSGLYNWYLFWFLKTQFSALRKVGTGTTIAYVSQNKSREMLIPLPPLAEQKRIVAKLEEILPLIDRYETAWNKLEEFSKRFPGDMQKSILQLAIQGKLVEQRSEEGTGEELFQRIQAEKQALIKSGKIKKEKTLPEITDDEIPFDIPDNWKWTRVAAITTLNPKNDLEDNLDTAFIPMPCVMDGFRNQHTFEIRKWKDIKKGFTHFANGDIGVAKITPCFQNRKSVIFRNLENGYGAGTTELSIVRTIGETISREYLLWFFKTDYFITNGMKSFTGTAGQQRIHKDYLATCLIPLPPLDEQKRIVAKLEEILPLCDRLK